MTGRRKKKRAAGEAAETEAEWAATVVRVKADIADSVLKTLIKKAKRLVERHNADTKAERNNRGEFLCDGMAVTGSNLVDLVKDILLKRKKPVPTG